MTELKDRHCTTVKREGASLDEARAKELLTQVFGWEMDSEAAGIHREFRFKNYFQTMAFVNAIAWIAHQEDHHPDLEVGYNRCLVRFSTHSVGGLTENDFICAAKLDALGSLT